MIARAAAVLGTTALLAGLTAVPAGAATPESSTLKAPKGTGTVASSWSGSFDYPALEASVLLAYDAHQLSIAIPGKNPAKYFKRREATLVIDLTWDGGSSNDMDLYVLDSESNTVASSVESGTDSERVTIPVTGPVTYAVEARNYLSAPGTAYEMTAFLVVTPG